MQKRKEKREKHERRRKKGYRKDGKQGRRTDSYEYTTADYECNDAYGCILMHKGCIQMDTKCIQFKLSFQFSYNRRKAADLNIQFRERRLIKQVRLYYLNIVQKRKLIQVDRINFLSEFFIAHTQLFPFNSQLIAVAYLSIFSQLQITKPVNHLVYIQLIILI